MERITYKIQINAPRARVWNTLWDDNYYRVWTSVFNPGSRAETDWHKGSKVLFLGDDGNGMVSMIEDKIPNELMSFKHLGIMKDGNEITDGPDVEGWAGAMENYILRDVDGQTEVIVEIDLNDEWKDYFNKTWPKALEKLKEIAEGETAYLFTKASE